MLAFDKGGGGAMGEAIRSLDWAATAIGAPEQWPLSLRSIVNLMLNSGFPMFLAWGPDLTFLYNDPYTDILGSKHPAALGRPFQEIWSEIWADVGPLAERALAGQAVWQDDLPLVMERHGYPEQTWFTFSYSPALDDDGKTVGVFCACTETTEKVLAVRANAEERRRLAQLFGEAPAFMALLTGRNHVFQLANDAYMQLVGHREIIGKAVHEALPEVAGQGFFELLDRVYASGEPFVGQQLPVQLQRSPGAQPEQAYVDFVYQPILDAANEVTGIFVTGYDVTELKRAEDRLRIAQEAGGIGSFELLPESRTIEVSQEFCRIWGMPYAEVLPLDETLKAIHPEDVGKVLTGSKEIGEESLGYVEYRIIRPDNGAVRWIARRGEGILDAQQDVVRLAGVIYDITDRKLAEEALASHAKTLETLNETGAALASDLDQGSVVQQVTDAGVNLIGAEFGAFFYNIIGEDGEAFMLYSLSGADASDFSSFPHPRATAVFKPTFDGVGIIRSDDITKDPRYGLSAPHFGIPKGHLPVRSYLAVPVKARSGEVLGGLFFGHSATGRFTAAQESLIAGIASQAAIALDNARLYREAQEEIAQRRRAEEHQQLLINELNHRVKNTLAIVQSLAQQTFKGETPQMQAREAFDARLATLAAAHNLLTRKNWEPTSLRDSVLTSIAATVGTQASRVQVEGPDILLSPQTAVSIAMAVHELCTNAIKYGALSGDQGEIDVHWSIQNGAIPPVMRLVWAEKGGPPVQAPARKGFGSRLIERGIAAELRGSVQLAFEPGGVVCTIEAPLPTIHPNA